MVMSIEAWMVASKYREKGDFIFLGHSLGAYIGCHYVIKYPQSIIKVVLMSPVGVPQREEVFDPEEVV